MTKKQFILFMAMFLIGGTLSGLYFRGDYDSIMLMALGIGLMVPLTYRALFLWFAMWYYMIFKKRRK